MKAKVKRLLTKGFAVVIIFYWMFMLLFFAIDSVGLIADTSFDINETLAGSSFARGMFLDIGGLSMVIAAWMVVATKGWYRWIFAVASLFVGSVAALPYISFYLWNEAESNRLDTDPDTSDNIEPEPSAL